MSLFSNEITSLISNNGFCAVNEIECIQSNPASFLWILLLSPLFTDGVITNISVIQIPSWFFALTPFESIFIGFTLLWICALQYIGVIPINLNNLFYGSPTGRRKRRWIKFPKERQENHSIESKIENIVQNLLLTLKRLDKDECLPRTLCELEKETAIGYSPSNGIQMILNMFKYTSARNNENAWEFYKSAVSIGNSARLHSKSKICEAQYSTCNATSEEILNYVLTLNFDDMI